MIMNLDMARIGVKSKKGSKVELIGELWAIVHHFSIVSSLILILTVVWILETSMYGEKVWRRNTGQEPLIGRGPVYFRIRASVTGSELLVVLEESGCMVPQGPELWANLLHHPYHPNGTGLPDIVGKVRNNCGDDGENIKYHILCLRLHTASCYLLSIAFNVFSWNPSASSVQGTELNSINLLYTLFVVWFHEKF